MVLTWRYQDGDPSVPPLRHGDALSFAEFRRLWELHPEVKSAQLIDGRVFIEPFVDEFHGLTSAIVIGWIARFFFIPPRGVEPLAHMTTELFGTQSVEADILVRRHDGLSTIDGEGRMHGPPELAVEVASDFSVGLDLGRKKELYCEAGVLEYIVFQQDRIDWFILEDGKYRSLLPDANGVIESRLFPGLRLQVQAMLDQDIATVIAAVAQ